METPEEKDRLLGDYKKNLGQKECKYFNKVILLERNKNSVAIFKAAVSNQLESSNYRSIKLDQTLC